MSYRKRSYKFNRKGLNPKRHEDQLHGDLIDELFGDEDHWDSWVVVNRYSWLNTWGKKNPQNMSEYYICKMVGILYKMDIESARFYLYEKGW